MAQMKWTKQQEEAIYKRGQNIIVSAGAGSGKTAVLTTRIINVLKSNVRADRLLVLTFTNAAAAEMKNRIIKKMRQDLQLIDRVDEIDNAYITTFDSFSLSIVKKYHYLLNLSPKIQIVENSVMHILKQKFLNEIIENKFEKKEEKFLKLIDEFTLKNTNSLKKCILNIYSKLDLLTNKNEYLSSYIDNFYNNKNIQKTIDEYENKIIEKIKQIQYVFEKQIINIVAEEKYKKIITPYLNLFDCNSYDEVVKIGKVSRLLVRKDDGEELLNIKNFVDENANYINERIIDYKDKKDIYESILSTKSTAIEIIDIIINLDKKIQEYKKQFEVFEFNDIAKMALSVLKNNMEVVEELKKQFYEILIDEYQDTNDLQEEFINLIANNNIYMVGDVKQSIYRFRNANPSIFKNKYDAYKKNLNGYKIDLNKNFRSNKYVLNSINQIFSFIMDDKIGEASYRQEHQMEYGLKKYDESNVLNPIEFIEYENEEKKYTNIQIELFYILKDIQDKINSKTEVFDSEEGIFRPCKYSDFAILIDRSKDFEMIRKLFVFYNIPVHILKDELLTSSTIVFVLQNLIKLWIYIKEKKFDSIFNKLFFSVGRSFLFNYNDQQLFDYITNKTFKESTCYTILDNLECDLQTSSICSVLKSIIEKLNIYEKLILIGDISSNSTRIQCLINIASSMETLNMDIYEFVESIDEIFKTGVKIEFSNSEVSTDKVKVMTIHKSKGLEFPICYFIGNYNKFNFQDIKDRFVYDKEYGLILPVYKNGIKDSIHKFLVKEKYNLAEISEKIRLLYVALTRSRERFIVINENNGKKIINQNLIVDDLYRQNYTSFKDVYDSINNILSINKIDVNSLNINDDYLEGKNIDVYSLLTTNSKKITHINIVNRSSVIKKNSASKKMLSLLKKEQLSAIEFGTYMHKILETIDLKNPDYSNLNDKTKGLVEKFLNLDIFKNIQNAKVYKEYEFIDTEEKKIHGIVDLLLEYDNYIDIIDYKLKNINDEAYINQLNIYKDYFKKKTDKTINIYLYSIYDNVINKIV